jgi:transcription elongation factor SPT6
MDLIDDRAVLDDEDEDESIDEETGEVRNRQNGANGRFDDSSEDEEDDDDEEAAAEVGLLPICACLVIRVDTLF